MIIFEYIKELLGITTDHPIVLYALSILILSCLALLCFINIMFYFYLNYMLDKNKYISELRLKWLWLDKGLLLYKKLNNYYITLEVILFVIFLGVIINTSYNIIYAAIPY